MLTFDRCEVSINGTGILADSAQISSQSVLQEVRALGYKGIYGQTVSGPQTNNFQVSYTVDVLNEPIFNIANNLRSVHQNTVYPFFTICIGGISGVGFLENYAIRSLPNQITKAQASFVVYTPLSGTLTEVPNSFTNTTGGMSGLNHGWTVFFGDAQASSNRPILSFEYGFRANWQAIYKVGSNLPAQVQMLGGQESAKIVHEDFRPILYSGETIAAFENTNTFKPSWTQLSFLSNSQNNVELKIDLSRALVNTTQMTITDRTFATVETSIQTFF